MCRVCAPAGACLGVAGSAGVSGTRRGACPLCRQPALPLRCPRGACRFRSPVNPAFSLLFRPYPPSPLPGGKGEIFCFLMQGALPLASPRAEPGRHRLAERRRCPEGAGSLPCRSVGSRWASGIRVVKKASHPQGYLHGRACKCCKRSNAGVPGAKPPAK